MQIGFINFSQEELARKNKVLQMVRDQTAIDELGLGRIRDAFANLMFPGMSTLQRRAKYFAVMPSLFYEATKNRYKDIREVRQEVTRLEVRLTEKLAKGAKTDEDIIGITGSSMIEAAKNDLNKFVKYDPAYIYMSGLRTYGMVRSNTDIYKSIYDYSRREKNKDPENKDLNTGTLDGTSQPFFTCGKDYNFDNTSPLPLGLDAIESNFIKRHITKSTNSENSMLAYILRKNLSIDPDFDNLGSLWDETPEDFADHKNAYFMAQRFSNLAHIIHLRFNHIASIYNEDENEASKLQKEIESLRTSVTCNAVNKMLDFIQGKVTDTTAIAFCRKAAENIEGALWEELDKLIIDREKAVKPGRTKLRNTKYKGEKRKWPNKYSFRWNEIVYRVITEIREGEKNG